MKTGSGSKPIRLSVHKPFDFPQVGVREMYLMYHEELESLVKNIPGIKRMRFWMTFGQEYLTHLRVLQNVGMTRIDPVKYQGSDIVPLQFLKALLPEPSSLAEGYTGKTCIGCMIEGVKDGKPKNISSTTSAITPNASGKSRPRPYPTPPAFRP